MTLPEALPTEGRGSAPGLPPLPPRLVLVAAGPSEAVSALLQQAAPSLARALGVVLGAGLAGGLAERPAGGAASGDPAAQLAALLACEPPFDRTPPGPALVPLQVDPGLSLQDGSCWAEALGAWRQPTVALLSADQLRSGLPAALTALLRQAGVPLVGLVQWGLPWEPQRRRREGLPWLGALDGAGTAAVAPSVAAPDQGQDQDLARQLALALRLASTQLA